MFPKYTAGHWRDGSLQDWGQSLGKTGTEGKWLQSGGVQMAEEVFCNIYFTMRQRGSCQTWLNLQSDNLLQDEDYSSAVCRGIVRVERCIFPENLRVQCSELWGIKGEQQEGHGDSTKGTLLHIYNN